MTIPFLLAGVEKLVSDGLISDSMVLTDSLLAFPFSDMTLLGIFLLPDNIEPGTSLPILYPELHLLPSSSYTA